MRFVLFEYRDCYRLANRVAVDAWKKASGRWENPIDSSEWMYDGTWDAFACVEEFNYIENDMKIDGEER